MNLIKRLARILEVLAWAGFFLLAAFLLALRFWLLPDIERYREHIVSALSTSIGQPVRIGAIRAHWNGPRAELDLSDVRIYDAEGREALVLPAVEKVISWRSLVLGELRLHSLAIERPRLAVRRDASGALFIAGMKLSGEANGGGFADWLLAQEEIVVRDAEIEWHDERRGAPALTLSGVEFRLRNDGEEHSIGLTANPPAELGTGFELRALLTGRSINELEAWNGRVYAELGYTDLAGWRAWLDYPLDVRQGKGALRLWASLENGELKRATADVELAGVVARLAKDLPALELASVRGRLQGSMEPAAYELAGRRLALVVERGPAMGPSDFRLSWKRDGDGAAEQGSLQASPLELAPLARIAGSLPLPQELRKALAEHAPRGRLLDTRLEWQGPLEKPLRLAARARLADLAIRARGRIPGFSGLSGSVEATESRGVLQIAARKATLDLPRVFPEPRIQLDALAGQLEWTRQGDGVQLRFPSLAFGNEHLGGNASGAYAYEGSGPGTIDLSAQLARADGRHTARYLPLAAILGEETREWLAAAILDGHASDVRVRLKGDLRDFPFPDPRQGQFQVAARVHKGALDYAEGWPRIHDIEGELLFERDRMEIRAKSGAILGTRLSNVRVSIPSMLAPQTHLAVAGEAQGPTSEFLRYIGSSPVREMIGGFTDRMGAGGAGRLSLKLEMPLEDLRYTRVAGNFELIDNLVNLHPELPPVERASGKVSFTESGLTVHDVNARLFGGPVTLTGGTRAGWGTEIVAKGEAPVAATRRLYDHPWRRYLSGNIPYVATMALREGLTRLSFESSLLGVASTLPAPLAKRANETLPLRIDMVPAEGGTRDRISISLARLANAEILRRREGESMVVQRTAVRLSPSAGEPMRLPERAGLLVYGSLAQLDLDPWLALEEASANAPGAAVFDLGIGALDVYGKRLTNLSLRAGTDAAGWSASIKADEMAGEVSYRSEGGGKVIARFADLTIPEDSPGAGPQNGARVKELPALDLVAERFMHRGHHLGRIEVGAQRAGPDWRIDRLSLVNPDASLAGKGLWHSAAPSRTSLDFALEVNDSGKLLERVGYAGLVKAAKARMQAALTWDGDPTAFDYASLSGNLDLQVEEGQFLEIEPGLGKLVSLMSLQALPRRIALDFRDVFSKGFQFDRIHAAARIDGGVMKLRDFKMRGSAAEVEMSGETDLARETQKLQVRVVPSLGDSASTVIGLVNPAVGVASLIAQRVLKNPLGQIFAYEYEVTGTWSDPKVRKVLEAHEAAPGPFGN
jgi:uncharacterized protein (TIGR02099 family)